MTSAQLVQQAIQTASPLSTQQNAALSQLVDQLTPIQQAWVSGYLSAISQSNTLSLPTAAEPTAQAELTILVGSQTGNAKSIATKLHEQASNQGLAVKLVNMSDYKPAKLKKEQFVAIVVSTHGEGDAPDDAITLHKFLYGKKAPKLDGLKYSVLALGDSSYEFYCKTGHDFDQRLAELGASRLSDIVECDVDFEESADAWVDASLALFEEQLKQINGDADNNQSPVVPFTGLAANTAASSSAYSRNTPFSAELLANQKITSRNSSKDVRHIELSLEDSDISYQAGDALGVWFDNDPQLVDKLLALLSIEESQTVDFEGQQISIKTALVKHFELTQLHPGFVEKYAQYSGNDELAALLADKAALRSFVTERQVIDVVSQYPVAKDSSITAEQLVASLRKISPRLYSIASAQAEVEEEVHLTVAVVDYEAYGERHLGGASGFLAHRADDESITGINIYVEENSNFRLPQDNDTNVIMIGPGTGIAPFRAFLQQREANEAEGKNWLFFGNQHFIDDFLYQSELISYRDSGLLTRLDVAFSRDQEQKVYVQDRIKEQGEELFQWLSSGAHLYICGDGNRMAKDVHQALISVICEHGKQSIEQAEEFLDNLREQRKYQKDVY